jgi:small subunit ribosomal protein S13
MSKVLKKKKKIPSKGPLLKKLSMLTVLSKEKYSVNTFRSIYGINRISASKINSLLGLHPAALKQAISVKQVKLVLTRPHVCIDFKLRKIVFRRLAIIIGGRSYRGFRLLHGLPCRGQRTKSNAKTPARLLASKRFLPLVPTKSKHLLEDFIENQRKKKKRKGISGHLRVFKKGKKAKMSKTKAKKIRKLREMKKKVKRKNALSKRN